MKTSTKFNFKTLTVLILSLVLCCSLAFTAACSDSNGSSSSSSAKDETVYPTDVQSVTNGDFEFSTFKTEAKNFPVSSSIGWTLSRDSYNSSYAPSSTYSSGIIDTAESAYNEIAEKAGFTKLDDGTYYNPKTPYDSSLVKDSEYVVRNESGKTVNDDKLPMKGSKVLMIHNATSESGEGTAQKFTSSSSLSLEKGKYGKISLWVKTYGLKSAYESGEYGAYIAIENTVSSSLSPVIVKNIDTKGEWVKYTFCLAANDLTDSSFKIVLGLGFGSGKFKNEYTEGFAYFDDVNFTEVSAADYNASGAIKTFDLFDSNGETASENSLIVKADNTVKSNENKEYAEKKYVVNHSGAAYSSVNFGGAKGSGDAISAADVSVASAISAVNATEFVGENKVVAPVSREGKALYAIKNSATDKDTGNFEYTTSSFSVASGKYYAYSFFVKSSLEVKTRTGLTVTVNDLGKNGTSDDDKKTTSLVSNLCTDGYENADNNDWRRYTVLVSNVIDADETSPAARNFSLTFSFGNDDGDNWKKAKGFFVIANFESKELTESEYNFANTTDAVKVSLTADLPNGVKGDDETSDSYDFTYSVTDSLDVKNGVAKNVIGYKGVKGGSIAVGGDKDNVYVDENVVAGVINTENLDSGNAAKLTSAQIAEIKNLGKHNATNKYLQPLMINNLSESSYGFYGSSQTLSANTTTLFTVKVKTFGAAKAFVYLADANALDGFGTFGVNAEAYDDVAAVNKTFATEVTSGYQTVTDDGWYVVYFVVTTGNASKNVRIELFNGSRDGETLSSGVVLFDSVTKTTVDAEDFKAELKANYGDSDDTADVTSYTRKPTVIKYDDDNGSLTNSVTGKKYSEKTVEYDETAVFTVYKNSKAIIGSLATIDITHEIDNRTSGDSSDSSSSDDSTSTDEDQSFSWALQITSIIIAAVLIVLLVVVLVRMIVKKSGKNKAVTKTYYNRDSRDKATAAAISKKAKAAKAEGNAPAEADDADNAAEPEVKPYDYDNMENNIEPEASDDAVENADEPVAAEGETADTADATVAETPAEEKAEEPADNGDKAE